MAGAIACLAIFALPAVPGSAVPGSAGTRVLAHAELVASSPGAGTVIADPPDEIRLVFSEPIEEGLSSLDVVRQDGTVIVDHAGTVDPDDPFALVLSDPGLGEGVYSVTWRSLSAADGHSAQGFFTFGIGTDPQVLPQVPGGGAHASTDPISVVGKWLTYLGLLLGVGIALFHRAVLRAGPMPVPLVRLLAALLAISSAATIVMAVASAIEAGSLGGYLFGSRNGLLQVARAAVADVGAVLLLVVPRRLAGAVAATTGLVGILLLIMAGHAAALSDPVPVIVGIVHVLAVAVWVGGLAGLVLVIFRPALIIQGQPPRMREIVPRFSALALAAIGMVTVTGAYEVWVETGELLPIGTEYGRTLLMKTALAVGAFALGSLNYFDGGRMRPWLDGFPTRIAVESMTAAAVLVLAAALAATPPSEGQGVEIAPIPDAFGNVAPDMAMEIVPGRPGVNRVVVTATDALISLDLSVTLDQLDAGTSSTAPLVPRGLEGMAGMQGMDHNAMATRNEDGTLDWTADAIVLPAGSSWDATVEATSTAGTELARQRFGFALDDQGISEGEATSLLNPGAAIAMLLLGGGAVGLGLGLGGFILPRCEASASRLALLGGGTTGVLLGALIGLQALLA